MLKKDVFQEDKFGVRFFIYNRKKYFVVNDLNGSANKHTLVAINRYLNRDAQLKIFGHDKNDAKVPKFCLSFAQYKVINKQEIKEIIEGNSNMTLSDVSMEWLAYHKIKVQVKKRRGVDRTRDTADVMYRKVLKYKITYAANSVTETREIV